MAATRLARAAGAQGGSAGIGVGRDGERTEAVRDVSFDVTDKPGCGAIGIALHGLLGPKPAAGQARAHR